MRQNCVSNLLLPLPIFLSDRLSLPANNFHVLKSKTPPLYTWLLSFMSKIILEIFLTNYNKDWVICVLVCVCIYIYIHCSTYISFHVFFFNAYIYIYSFLPFYFYLLEIGTLTVCHSSSYILCATFFSSSFSPLT